MKKSIGSIRWWGKVSTWQPAWDGREWRNCWIDSDLVQAQHHDSTEYLGNNRWTNNIKSVDIDGSKRMKEDDRIKR